MKEDFERQPIPDNQGWSDDTTLGEVRKWLEDQINGKGVHCPSCGQFANIYRRSISGKQAKFLMLLYRRKRYEFVNISLTVPEDPHGELKKLRWWGLISDQPNDKQEQPHDGWWRVTPLGGAWVLGVQRIPRDAYVYDNVLLKLSDARGTDSIRDRLGKKFDYDDLFYGND